MRSIAIIGAGQAGLSLALKMKKEGHDVTLFTNRTAKQIKDGRIMSSQGMFNKALEIERKWSLNFWDKECPWNQSVTFTLGVPGISQIGVQWKGKTDKPFQSIDQRIKFSRWIDEFKNIGGKVVIQDVGINELNTITKWHELTVVTGGKGEISQQFPRDDKRSIFNRPQRALACMYVKGMSPEKNFPGVRANIIPGIGEYFTMPGLTLSGHCEMMLFEGIPGGAFDSWNDITTVEEQLQNAKKLLKEYVPWEFEKCAHIEITDSQATLIGRYTPVVRQPAKMPCGKFALPGGDTGVLNDPIAGQGANTAMKCAEIYSKCILERGNKPFDDEWIKETFEKYWKESAQAATQWSNLLLLPPPPHVIELLSAATRLPMLADKYLANAFDEPSILFPWITDPIQTKALIEEIEAEENQFTNSLTPH